MHAHLKTDSWWCWRAGPAHAQQSSRHSHSHSDVGRVAMSFASLFHCINRVVHWERSPCRRAATALPLPCRYHWRASPSICMRAGINVRVCVSDLVNHDADVSEHGSSGAAKHRRDETRVSETGGCADNVNARCHHRCHHRAPDQLACRLRTVAGPRRWRRAASRCRAGECRVG